MSQPLAYHISWTTYGTWLPGDERGWVEAGKYEIKSGDQERRKEAQSKMTDPPTVLDPEQRAVVEETIQAHCHLRNWQLHAVNARTNHIHVVVTAVEVPPEAVLNQLKAWCSRRLNELEAKRGNRADDKKRWWTHHGSTKWINDEEYFRNAVTYVTERQ